jgi:hypothetical protein
MRKYLLIGLFTFVSYTPLLASYQIPDKSKTLGGRNTCSPRSIECPDGSTVVSYACGSVEQAKEAACK